MRDIGIGFVGEEANHLVTQFDLPLQAFVTGESIKATTNKPAKVVGQRGMAISRIELFSLDDRFTGIEACELLLQDLVHDLVVETERQGGFGARVAWLGILDANLRCR